MAPRITLPKLLFSSSLQTLTVRSEAERVNVQISIKAHSTDVFHPIWDQDYYTSGGSVVLRGINEVVQNEMQMQVVSDIRIILTDLPSLEVSEYNSKVIFCSLETPFSSTSGNSIEDFLASRMLMASRFYRVGKSTPIQVNFYSDSGTYTHYWSSRLPGQDFHKFSSTSGCKLTRGIYTSSSVTFEGMNKTYQHNLRTFHECAIIPQNSPKAIVNFYHDPELDDAPVFYFLNCFHGREYVSLPAVIVDKTEVSAQEASVGGIPTQYDLDVTRKYEVTVGPLFFDEIGIFRQLVTSENVRIRRESLSAGVYSWRDIIISDVTCEFSDNPEEPQTAKFTFRYKSASPMLDIEPGANIFNDNFDPTFD